MDQLRGPSRCCSLFVIRAYVTDMNDETDKWLAPVPLDVPYSEKDEAKALGARWYPAGKRWFATASNVEALKRWKALPDLGDILPGEDRSFGSGLFVDLIPRSCWFTNVRSCVPDREWERIKRMITKRADNFCEACGAAPDLQGGRMLEVHERWEFADVATTQRLKRLICLCTECVDWATMPYRILWKFKDGLRGRQRTTPQQHLRYGTRGICGSGSWIFCLLLMRAWKC